MSAIRSVWILALVVLAVVGGCAPGAVPSDTPPATEGAVGPMTDGTYFLWDPLAAAMAADYPLGSFSAARVDVEEAEGPEVGFTRPVEGTPNVEYLSSADRAAVEDTLLETLN
jgi:inosine-uridine nucleoside N-ribohydrolase